MRYDIYTDGSYKNIPGVGEFYGCGAFIAAEDPNIRVTLSKASGDELVSMRNVSGEILAVMMALEHCLNVLKVNQQDELHIYHDYVGISNWVKRKGEPDYWRAKNLLTQTYVQYMNVRVKTAVKVYFHHVTSHTGVPGNEIVDRLAKKAIDDYIAGLH